MCRTDTYLLACPLVTQPELVVTWQRLFARLAELSTETSGRGEIKSNWDMHMQPPAQRPQSDIKDALRLMNYSASLAGESILPLLLLLLLIIIPLLVLFWPFVGVSSQQTFAFVRRDSLVAFLSSASIQSTFASLIVSSTCTRIRQRSARHLIVRPAANCCWSTRQLAFGTCFSAFLFSVSRSKRSQSRD